MDKNIRYIIERIEKFNSGDYIDDERDLIDNNTIDNISNDISYFKLPSEKDTYADTHYLLIYINNDYYKDCCIFDINTISVNGYKEKHLKSGVKLSFCYSATNSFIETTTKIKNVSEYIFKRMYVTGEKEFMYTKYGYIYLIMLDIGTYTQEELDKIFKLMEKKFSYDSTWTGFGSVSYSDGRLELSYEDLFSETGFNIINGVSSILKRNIPEEMRMFGSYHGLTYNIIKTKISDIQKYKDAQK